MLYDIITTKLGATNMQKHILRYSPLVLVVRTFYFVVQQN